MATMNVWVPRKRFKLHEAKWTKLKGKTDNSKIIVGDFNSPSLAIERTNSKKKKKKSVKKQDLNNSINHFALITLSRTSQPINA